MDNGVGRTGASTVQDAMTQLSDFLPYYPPQNDPQIQTKIGSMKEFKLDIGRKDVTSPESGLFAHQELFKRIMMVYDRCLLYGAAGIGKTYSYIALREELKNTDSYITKSYIFTGKQQISDFRDQLVFGPITSGKYITENIKRSQAGQSVYKLASRYKSAITRSVSKAYTAWTYAKLDSYMTKETASLSAEQINQFIIREFSGTLFFLDEIQFMKIPGDGSASDAKIRKFMWVWRIVHVAHRCKVVVSTATPAITDLSELLFVINLLAPLNNQILDRGGIMMRIVMMSGLIDRVSFSNKQHQWSIEDIKSAYGENVDPTLYYVDLFDNYLRGMVIHVAQADTGVVPTYEYINTEGITPGSKRDQMVKALAAQSKSADNSQVSKRLRILTLAQGGVQLEAYDNYIKYSNDNVAIDGKKYNAFHTSALSIITFTFPKIHGGVLRNYGSEGYNYWIRSNKNDDFWLDEQHDQEYPIEQKFSWMLTNNLQSMSIKMWYIINEIMRVAPDENGNLRLTPGKWYIFTPIVKQSGANVLGLALQYALPRDDDNNIIGDSTFHNKMKFQRFRFVDTAFLNKGRPLKGNLPEANRYAIVSTNIDTIEMDVAFAVYNHPDNIDGRYIKVLMLSRVGQTGLNLSEVKARIVALRPGWGPGEQYQAIMRAIRAKSHTQTLSTLPESERPLRIQVDLLATILPSGERSIDVLAYERIGKRDKAISYAARALKIINVAAWPLYNRNNLGLEDGSPECDYQSCVITPYMPAPTTEISKNYDIYYSQFKVDKIIKLLRDYFSRTFSATIEHVEKYLGIDRSERKYVYMALIQIMENKTVITDTFGMYSVLKEATNVFYVSESLTRSDTSFDYLSSYYSTNFIGVISSNISDIVIDRERIYGKQRVEHITGLTHIQDVVLYMSDLNRIQKIVIVEKFIEMLVRGELSLETPIVGKIYNMLLGTTTIPGQLIFTQEPLKGIDVAAGLIGTRREGSLSKHTWYENVEIEGDLTGDNARKTIFAHCIFTSIPPKHRAAAAARAANVTGRLRILDISRGYWRDTVLYESNVYRNIFQKHFDDAEAIMEERSPVFAKFLSDGAFRVADKRFQEIKYLKSGKVNRTTVHKGSMVIKSNDYKIADMLWASGYRITYQREPLDENTMRAQLVLAIRRCKRDVNLKKDIWGIKKSRKEGNPNSDYYYIIPSPDPDHLVNTSLLPYDRLVFMWTMLNLGVEDGLRERRETLMITLMNHLVREGKYTSPHCDAYRQYTAVMNEYVNKLDRGQFFFSYEHPEYANARVALLSRL